MTRISSYFPSEWVTPSHLEEPREMVSLVAAGMGVALLPAQVTGGPLMSENRLSLGASMTSLLR
jgi:hypothetical protein